MMHLKWLFAQWANELEGEMNKAKDARIDSANGDARIGSTNCTNVTQPSNMEVINHLCNPIAPCKSRGNITLI